MSEARRQKSLRTAAATRVPAAGPQPAPLVSGRVWLVSLALGAITLLVYAPVWHLDFITLDDPKYVLQNPFVLAGFSWRGLRWAFTTNYDGNWFPLTWLSLMLDGQIHGRNAGGYHLTNLAFHIANALLVFALLYWITGALGRSAFVAGLFAVHPLHVESVAWVTERKDVLSGLFFVLTLWAYAAYVKRPNARRYGVVLALFALGLMAKPMLVTLPFVLLLLDYWPLGRLSTGWNPGVVWPLVKEKLPLFALSLISSIVTFIVQKQGGAVSRLEALPFNLRLENSAVAYLSYIGKMLWPARLALLYPYSRSLPASWVIASVAALLVLTVLVIWAGARCRYLPVGWFWYLGTLVPVIGLVQVGYQSMADRYTYLPLIGLFLIVAWGAVDAAAAHLPYARIALPTAAALIVLASAVAARGQLGYWQSSLTLWQHTLEVTTNNSHAHNNLGMALAQQGRADEAIAQYEAALRLNPNDAETHNNLGNALFRRGDNSGAIPHYSEAVRIRSNMAEAHNGLAAALAGEGRFEEAVTHYSEALRLNPNDADFHSNLASAFYAMGRTAEAIQQFSEAVRLLPSSAQAHYGFGVALERAGRLQEARQHFEAALRINPQLEEARQALERLAVAPPGSAAGP